MRNPLIPLTAICLVATCAAFAAGAAEKPVSGAQWTGKVTYVSDGDTVWVRRASDSKPVRIRIDGVDAPEICQAYGLTARKALAARLRNQTVNVQSLGRDNFGRLLARVTTVQKVKGSTDVGEWLVREGHAWSYRYRRDGGPYAKQQATAQAARKGLFSSVHPQEPREFRKQHGTCSDALDK